MSDVTTVAELPAVRPRGTTLHRTLAKPERSPARDIPRPRARQLLRTALQVAAAALHATMAIAIVWGGEPGSLVTQVTGSLTEGGPWSYAAAVALIVSGVSLLDADASPVTSACLSILMSGILTFAPLTPGLRIGVVALLAVTLPIAWLTREDRRAIWANPERCDEEV